MEIIEDLGIRVTYSGYRFRMVKAMCRCGNVGEYRKNTILTKNTKSCGCLNHLKKERTVMSEPSYSVLCGIRARCNNKNRKYYYLYGGRGITICKEWSKDSWAFIGWAKDNGYEKGLYIDRIDPNGNYEPSNCRFVDANINAQNKRLLSVSNKSGYRGVTKHIKRDNTVMWRARIGVEGKSISLGIYKEKEEAAIAYNNYVNKNNTDHPLNVTK